MKKKTIAVAIILGMMIPIIAYGVLTKFSHIENNQEEQVNIDSKVPTNYITDIYNEYYQSVVTVVNLKETTFSKYIAQLTGSSSEVTQGVGTGFIYKKQDGYYYAITNNHVVDGSNQIQIVVNDETVETPVEIMADLVGTNEEYDIAVVKFKTNYDISPVVVGNSDDVVSGESVIAIGSPYGLDFQGSVTAGIVSSPGRIMTDENNISNEYIQTDAAINPGNSGGPLFNSLGQVIGVNTMKISDSNSDNMGFSIPINTVMSVVEDIEANNE